MRWNSRWMSVPAAACLLLLLPPRPSWAQQEKALPPEALDRAPSLSLFGDDSEHRLLITGFGVGQYSYNFQTDRNSFGDSALAVAFSKVFSDHLSVFAQLTAAREDLSPFVGAETSSDIKTDIDNLQLSWVPSAQSGLEITFGKFDSPLAIERDDAPLNFQATGSWTFQYARPVKFAGLQVHEAFSPQLEAWAIVANGWDVDSDNNKAKTFALYGLWNPSLTAHVGLGVVQGAEKDDRTGDPRTTAVATLLFQPADKWVWGEKGSSAASRIPLPTAARRSGTRPCSLRTTGSASTGDSPCAAIISTTATARARGRRRS